MAQTQPESHPQPDDTVNEANVSRVCLCLVFVLGGLGTGLGLGVGLGLGQMRKLLAVPEDFNEN